MQPLAHNNYPAHSRATHSALDSKGLALMDKFQKLGIKSNLAIRAYMTVDRRQFVPSDMRRSAYRQTAIPVCDGCTVTNPLLDLYILERADIHLGYNVLEIGGGTGYTGALISKMVGARTPVYSLEILPEIAEQALRNHVAGHYNVRVLCRDGWAGHPEKAPFDRILVWAAVPTTIVLGNLKGQLAVGGIMIAPVQETHGHQRLAHIRRDGPGPEDFATNYLREPVNFVPLVDSLD